MKLPIVRESKSSLFNMEGTLNTLVFDYLSNINPKAANLFKKEVKPKALAVGSPGIKEIYTFFEANSPAGKRKKPAAESPKKAKKEVRFEINW